MGVASLFIQQDKGYYTSPKTRISQFYYWLICLNYWMSSKHCRHIALLCGIRSVSTLFAETCLLQINRLNTIVQKFLAAKNWENFYNPNQLGSKVQSVAHLTADLFSV